MTTFVAPPAKIKSFLAGIKETLLDKEESGIILAYFVAVLRLELLQRGVLLQNDFKIDEAKTSDSWKVLFEAIRSTAGKALLTNASSLPKQLLAGMSVIQGRLAEILGKLLTNETAIQQLSSVKSLHANSATLINDTVTRCKEVGEERFEVLLSLLLQADKSDSSISLSVVFPIRLLYIAEGCYLRAAEFSPEAPLMWKRASDAIQERQQYFEIVYGAPIALNSLLAAGLDRDCTSWEAITALQHLRQIAASKGNLKRVAQICLALSLCALDHFEQREDFKKKMLDSTTIRLVEAFVAPHRSICPCDPTEACRLANEYLTDSVFNDNSKLSEADHFLMTMLKGLTFFAQEENVIQTFTKEEYEAAKHRLGEGVSKKKLISLTELESLVRDQQLQQETPGGYFDERARTLRDALLFAISGNGNKTLSEDNNDDDIPKSLLLPAYQLMTRVILRYKLRAQAARLNRKGSNASASNNDQVEVMWLTIANFMGPLLQFLREKAASDAEATSARSDQTQFSLRSLIISKMSSEWNDMVREVVITLPCMEWILPGTVSSQDLWFAKDLIQLFHEQQIVVKSNQVVKSTRDSQETEVLRLGYALRSATALLYLAQTETGRNMEVIRAVSDTAMSARSEEVLLFDAEFGVSFLECIICWSGLHRSPWPFCFTAEARYLVLKAKECLELAKEVWGRHESASELWYLKLAKADTESSSLSTGMVREAVDLYTTLLESTQLYVGDGSNDQFIALMVQARCFSGLAFVALNSLGLKEGLFDLVQDSAETLARQFLKTTEHMIANVRNLSLFPWKKTDATKESLSYQLACARQLIADSMVRNENIYEAKEILEAAAQDSPNDPSAALSLGALHLRIMFLQKGDKSNELPKVAQTQLLRTAKMDSSQASPFALLGYWYEFFKDLKRAIGCYSKALLLDPSHPVAGRGLLRLRSSEAVISLLENATNSNSSSNGWAWRALGLHKAYVDGDDNLASVSLLKAIRCRDIEHPRLDSLSFFYTNPENLQISSIGEMAVALSELAASYHRQGRFTAALRTYGSAIEKAGNSVSATILCSCAQVEAELGLFDEAAEKFTIASQDADLKALTALGLGKTLLSMAKRDSQAGKAGAALTHLRRAITVCEQVNENFMCLDKIQGDLYTFGALLPPGVFDSVSNVDQGHPERRGCDQQLLFINGGISAYSRAEQALENTDLEENVIFSACLITDIATNLLFQAQLLSFFLEQGVGLASLAAQEMYIASETEFRRALELSPLYAPAWCGLGCTLATRDPLLAQHCFCRCLELDALFSDAYINLGFLYTANNALGPSGAISDALTQVADTPMMWINRALIFERQALPTCSDDTVAEAMICQAADAYRAALQMAPKHPCAMLGLSLTSRMDKSTVFRTPQESRILLQEFMSATSKADAPLSIMNGLSMMDESVVVPSDEIEVLMKNGRKQTLEGLEKLDEIRKVENEHISIPDTALIRTALSLSNDTIGSESDEKQDDEILSLSRQIYIEPTRGDLWLDLAKELIQELDLDPSVNALNTVQSTIRRSKTLLWQQVTDPPPHQAEKEEMVLASDVSDALSLSFWMERIVNEGPIDCGANSDVQCALILCPTNLLARKLVSVTRT